jgi:ribosomal small subunit protein bTHX
MEHTNGKGDRRSFRGKIYNGSYGKTRPHRTKKPSPAQKTPGAARPQR